jgi:hypothetical protein
MFESRGTQLMMAYRFGIGERVTYSEKRFPTGVWTTELVVVEQFPRDGLPEYRLRCQNGDTEYLLAENELGPLLHSEPNQQIFEPSPWAA